MRPSSRSRLVPAGFTLVELFTVLAMFGILAALVLPVIAKLRALPDPAPAAPGAEHRAGAATRPAAHP